MGEGKEIRVPFTQDEVIRILGEYALENGRLNESGSFRKTGITVEKHDGDNATFTLRLWR